MAKKLTTTQKMVIAHILSEVQDKMRYDEDYGEYVDGGDIIIVLDVTINVCGTLDLIRYTKGRKRGYNAVQVQQTDVNFKDLPVNVWL